jgi:propanol-preferring alcohol dehydrogenase
VTVYAALRKANAESGNFVVIMGAGGGLGHLAVQYSARGIGHRVIGIDHSSKKDLVLDSGAEHFIPVDGTESLADAVKSLTGGHGAHAVVVCTAHQGAYDESVNLLRFGGRVVCVGIPEGDMKPIASANAGVMVGKALQIVGSAVGTRKEAIEAVEFAARGIVKTHYRVEKLDKLTSVFEEMDKQQLKGRVVIDLTD